MSIEKIMKLAEAQANARVEAVQANLNAINAQMAQLQATRQLAIDALTAANAAKAKLEGMLDEHRETQEQPKKEEPKEQVTALSVAEANALAEAQAISVQPDIAVINAQMAQLLMIRRKAIAAI